MRLDIYNIWVLVGTMFASGLRRVVRLVEQIRRGCGRHCTDFMPAALQELLHDLCNSKTYTAACPRATAALSQV